MNHRETGDKSANISTKPQCTDRQINTLRNMDISSALNRLNHQLPLKARQDLLVPELKQLHHTILRSLAHRGVAPSKSEIAAVVGDTNVSESLRILGQLDLVVLNREGSAVLGAYPLTTEVTAHRITIGSNTIYAMCALDAVSVAPMFSEEATIDSHCRASGEPVHIHMRSSDVVEVSPVQVMVGIRWQMPCGAAAHSMCTEMVFLKDEATAYQWQDEDKENISVFALPDAIDFGTAFFVPLLH